MYKLVLTTKEGSSVLELKTESRSIARFVKMLEQENPVTVTVTKEVQPREVKFKGV